MRKRLRSIIRGGLLLILVAILMGVRSDSSGRTEALYGCRALGVDPYRHDSGPGEINYSLASPDGTYVASTSRFSDHGCVSLVIYQCRTQQVSRTMGCTASMPGQSTDWVLADEWLSNHELRIQRYDDDTATSQIDFLDAGSLFSTATPAPQ